MPRKDRSLLLASLLTILGLTIASCMDDPITGPEARALTTERPASIYFTAINPQGGLRGDLLVRWNPSSSSSQQNFQGYFVRLYDVKPGDTGVVEDTLLGVRDSAFVSRSDTSYIFRNVELGRYSVAVWGRRYSLPDRPDSLILSLDSAGRTFNYDPRPVFAPTNLRAVSMGPQTVRLAWDPSPTDTQIGAAAYLAYFREPDRVTTPHILGAALQVSEHRNYVDVTVPQRSNEQPYEKEYEFWVKTVRNDSTQSADSVMIRWAGAEQFHEVSFSIADSGLFVGRLNQRFAMNPTAPDDAVILFAMTGDELVAVGQKGTLFSDQSREIDSIFLSYFTAPIPAASYTQSSLTLPKQIPAGGLEIYARLKGTSFDPVVRLWIRRQPDGSLINSGRISITASYQPESVGTSEQLPYF